MFQCNATLNGHNGEYNGCRAPQPRPGNQDLLAQGLVPDHIFSKTFLDTFVFIGGSGSTSAQGGGVPVAQPRRTKPEINYPKKKVSARMVLWLTAVTIAFAVAVVTGITVYHITQEGITGGYEMPDPVGDENTETDDGQEL